MCDKISIVASMVSILLGIYAIAQARRYNNESKRINKDTEIILDTQLRKMEQIQREIVRNIPAISSIIYMAKDGGYINKLSNFKKENIEVVLDFFKKMRIKRMSYENIKIFLEDEKRERYRFDFFSMAETIGGLDIEPLEKELLKYGVLVQIDYDAKLYVK